MDEVFTHAIRIAREKGDLETLELLTKLEKRDIIHEESLRCKLAASRQFMTTYYLNQMKSGVLIIPGFESQQEQYVQEHDSKSVGVLVTINPQPDDLNKLKEVVEKIINKKWVTSYLYSYEQRGETRDSIHGYHAHILLKRFDKKPCQIISEIKNTCKHICPNVNISGAINFQWLTKTHYDNSIPYIKGEKAEAEKQLKCNTDKIFRQLNKLNEFYESEASILL